MNRIRTIKVILVVGFIVFLFVFLTQFSEITQSPIILEENFTFSIYESSLCEGNVNPRTVKTRRQCPEGGIVTVRQGGRLGNQIWEYASVWAVARRTGLDPYVPGCIRNTLDELFENLSIPSFEEISHCPISFAEVVNSLDEWKSPKDTILLPIYSRLFDVTVPYLQGVLEEFEMRKRVVEHCQAILRAVADTFPKPTQTFVGVHVRRTDYLPYLQWKYRNVTTADRTYFLEAMGEFERKYHDVIFVILSDDLNWCWETFSDKDNVFIGEKHSPVVDLALMASCNHTIYDYGTYGDWGSLLAQGDTIYFNLTVNPSAQMGEMLPTWRTIPTEL